MSERLSRRDFLRRAVVLGLAAAAGGEEVRNYFFEEQNEIWNRAGKENRDFLDQNKAELSHLKFGTSFAPEEFGLSQVTARNKYWRMGGPGRRMLDGLDFIIDDLGIRDIRLGIRWDNAVSGSGIDLSLYDPVITKCFDAGVNVTLNVGAIKTFRWPEEHVPRAVLTHVSTPKDGIVTPQDELAQHAGEYLDQLFQKLTSDYGRTGTERFVKIQPENEGFNAFGDKRWTMSDDYYKGIIRMIHKYFPNTAILLNSSAGNNLKQIDKLFSQVAGEIPDLSGRLTAGIDFHFDTPGTIRLWGVHPGVDPITASKLTHPVSADDFAQHKKLAAAFGINSEITEGQTEKYGKHTLAQESSQAFRFWVLRTAPHTDQMQYIWGSEVFAKKALDGVLTNENKKTLDLVRTIQARA